MKKTQKHKLRLVGRGRVELPDRVQLNRGIYGRANKDSFLVNRSPH